VDERIACLRQRRHPIQHGDRTLNAAGHYFGHAATYVSQDAEGMTVIDRWMTSPAKAIYLDATETEPA